MSGESQRRGRPALQRVPPHDTGIEGSLLGAALLADTAARIVADLDPGIFYAPRHQTIADAIGRLTSRQQPHDPVSVEAEIRRLGQLDQIGTAEWPAGSYLVHLQATCPATSSAAHWADLLVGFHRKRHILGLAAAVTEAVYTGTGHHELVTQMADAVAGEASAITSSWEPVNLAAVLAGDEVLIEPSVGCRTDGQNLLYPGRVHAFNGEPEAAKSLCAQLISAQEISAGNHVAYIDFEDTAASVTHRLLQLGVSAGAVVEYFHYVRPDEAIDAAARIRVEHLLDTWPITFAVIDGVAEAMALSGWDENSNSDVASFYARLPRLVAAHGPAVVLIDHLVKDAESQGRYARGAGHKLAAVDGAVYKIEAETPFGPGMTGRSRLILQKDRPGQLRQHFANAKNAAVFTVTSTADGEMAAELRPVVSTAKDPDWRPTTLMQRVSEVLEDHPDGIGKKELRSLVKGDNTYIDKAVTYLTNDKYITVEKRGQAQMHILIRPYRAPAETRPEDTDDPGPTAPPDSHDEYGDQPWR